MPEMFILPGPPLFSVPELVETQAQRQPLAVAVSSPDGVVTYGGLYERARHIASELARRGVPSGSVVATFVARGPDVLACQLGTWLHSCISLIIDPELPAERAASIVDSAWPAALLTSPAAQHPPNVRVTISVDELRDDGWHVPRTPGADPTPAYLIYTAGLTGDPKGVIVGHKSLAHLARWHGTEYAVRRTDRASTLAGIGFDAFLWETWPYLCAGASVHFAPDEVRTSPWELSEWWVSQDISIAYAPTSLAEAYIRRGSHFGQLRTLLTGGDQLRLTAGHPLREMVNHYGPSEATVVATRCPVDPVFSGLVGIGWPIPSAHTLILDEALLHVPVGQVGELYLGGDCVALGYVQNPLLTKEFFITIAGHPGRWYRTGDLVCIEKSGLAFKGRKDRRFAVGELAVEPAEVEVALVSHPAVDDVAISSRGTDLVAFVVTAEGVVAAEGELREHAAKTLPAELVPNVYRFLDRLPLTANGKVDRLQLATL